MELFRSGSLNVFMRLNFKELQFGFWILRRHSNDIRQSITANPKASQKRCKVVLILAQSRPNVSPQMLLIRKFNFCIQTKERILSHFLLMLPLGILLFALLDAARNREIMKPVRTLVLNRLNRPWIQSKQFIINCSYSIQVNLSFHHLL